MLPVLRPQLRHMAGWIPDLRIPYLLILPARRATRF